MSIIRVERPEAKMILRDLQDGPLTREEIELFTRRSRATVIRYLRDMHKAGLIFVSGWEHSNRRGGATRVFSRRTSPFQRDVPRPPAKTSAQLKREHRARRNSVLHVGAI
jgi:hypothetical protein